jgi:peptide/nickel transport system permease protein
MMGKKVARRLLISIFSLWVISLLSFGLMELTPGGPMAMYAENPKITYADRMRIAQQLGLDKPAHVRYVIWVKNVVRGDLGTSYATGRPVTKEILARLPATLKLMTVSFILSVMIAIPIGIYSATHRYSVFDNIVTTGSFFGLSLPVFWFGILMIFVFSIWLKVLPGGGHSTPWFNPAVFSPMIRPFAVLWEHARYLIMPATVLSLMNTAKWSRYMRSSMIEVTSQNYIRTARAKGVPEKKVIYKHAVRNALTPIITIMGLDLPGFFAGAVVTETIFAWPGMGRLFITSVFGRDYQVLMGIVIITAVLVLLGNFLADLLYTMLDPRVKYEG